jgi:uncharacterized protein (DUF362 family)
LVKTVLVRWFLINSVLSGILALCWLLLRSGRKPSRLAYPCQQAAFATAVAAFGAPIVAAVMIARRRLFTLQGAVIAAAALLVSFGLWAHVSRTDAYTGPRLDPPRDYTARIFHETDCPQSPVGEHFAGLDDLIEKMGGHGLKFYRSSIPSLTAGPEGILASDDVVLVKINYQWDERGGTNTDLLRGLIRRIVDHPDSFTGEVVVVENAQFRSTENLDRDENNAEDHALSPRRVVLRFQAQGYKVSLYDWTLIRTTAVNEYDLGDMNDGYIVYDYDAQLDGRKSYPKFRSDHGTHISLKYGIWNQGIYDRERLKFINVPVLKSHHSTYGVTAAVKHYMGVVTGALSTTSHGAIRHGMLGAVMGEIQLADLNLLDAIWINADPYTGPRTYYDGATRMDQLVASTDPVALDRWAAKNILIPAFIANGHSPPWPVPSADPDDPLSAFREYLDNSMSQILAAGYEVTNDYAQMDAIQAAPPGEVSNPQGPGAPFRISRVPEGYELSWSQPVQGGDAAEYNLYRVDLATLGAATQPECESHLGQLETAVLPTLPEAHGFLVVGRNSVGDGSFGRTGGGAERPSPAESAVCP